uniref:RRM domain-containing protein n=1 Tax=Kryptolebias marmoratus TaxID=37003 RepID=A0A3Q3GHH9_KRYMA
FGTGGGVGVGGQVRTAVVQVTNLSSAVSSEQMRTLFEPLSRNTSLSFSSKVCYIKYRDPSSVGVAQHLTNTVFIDRALIVVPCAEGDDAAIGVVLCCTPFQHCETIAPTEKRPCLISYGS